MESLAPLLPLFPNCCFPFFHLTHSFQQEEKRRMVLTFFPLFYFLKRASLPIVEKSVPKAFALMCSLFLEEF